VTRKYVFLTATKIYVCVRARACSMTDAEITGTVWSGQASSCSMNS